MSVWKYVRKALVRPLNLAVFAVGVGVTAITGQWEIGLPLVIALDAVWLGFAANNPKFQQYVDIQEHKLVKADDALETQRRMRMMRASLPRTLQRRFERLKEQCDIVRSVTKEYRDANRNLLPSLNDDEQVGLDRLMWLYLKLIYAEHSLNRYFDSTSIDLIQRQIHKTETRLNKELSKPEDQQQNRIVQMLQANLKSSHEQSATFDSAKASYELVLLEQKQLENQITTMQDVGIHKGDQATLSADVDTVVETIQESEKALTGLEFVTGFSSFENEPIPEIVSRRQRLTAQ